MEATQQGRKPKSIIVILLFAVNLTPSAVCDAASKYAVLFQILVLKGIGAAALAELLVKMLLEVEMAVLVMLWAGVLLVWEKAAGLAVLCEVLPREGAWAIVLATLCNGLLVAEGIAESV